MNRYRTFKNITGERQECVQGQPAAFYAAIRGSYTTSDLDEIAWLVAHPAFVEVDILTGVPR